MGDIYKKLQPINSFIFIKICENEILTLQANKKYNNSSLQENYQFF